jgi:phage tail sheath protein FI
MAVQVSPGVYSREVDLSLYVPALSSTIFGVIGGARKGPKDVATPVGSLNEFVDVFGYPCSQMGYAAMTYLRYGRQLVVVRVGNGDVASYVSLLDGSGIATLKVSAISTGEWGNDIKVYVDAGTTAGTVKLTVELSGLRVEQFDNLQDSTAPAAINGVSRNVVVEDLGTSTNNPATGAFALTNGNNGISSLIDADYIGVTSGDDYTGMQCFSDPDQIDCNLLAVPGVSSAAVINAGLSLSQARADTLYIADPPYGLSTNEVIDWHNGAGVYSGLHQAFNSSYGCLQWGWHQIYDPYSKGAVWIAPSGPFSAICAYTDYNSELWFPPAGFIRGRVVESLAIEYSPRKGQRDFLQQPGNNVNPFVNFQRDGIVLFGQKTLQRAPTALDRIATRRMLLYAEKALATAAKYLTFEPNDVFTWDKMTRLAEAALNPIKARRGMYDFRVICDASTNPSYQIDQNKMVCKVIIKPMKFSEIIELVWTLVSTGSEFTEVA